MALRHRPGHSMPTIKGSSRRTVPRHAMAASGQPAVTIKSRAFTMPILHINAAEPAAVVSALDELLETHRDFFAAKIPVVLDLSDGAPENQTQLHQLINALKKLGLLPCAVVGDEAVRAQAILAGLGVFGQQDAHRQTATAAPDASIRPQESGPRPSWPLRVVKGQVRSGQQIHAPSSDIVVLGSVNAGAEVMADGSIHVYGVLRGRALAGARGNQEARIFCHALEAELVAIAGFYLTAEELDVASHGKPSCIRLEDETLVVEAFVV